MPIITNSLQQIYFKDEYYLTRVLRYSYLAIKRSESHIWPIHCGEKHHTKGSTLILVRKFTKLRH